MNKLALFVLVILVSGCAAPFLKGEVTRFHILDAQPKTFAVIPDDGQEGSLEFRTYAALVSDQLRAHGWSEAPPQTADVAVFMRYEISRGYQGSRDYPIFGTVPTGNSTTYGTVNSFGNTATYNSTTTQQTALAVVGSGTENHTEYDREVHIVMYSLPAYRQSQKMESLYEGKIRSSGSIGALPRVMPTLINGLLKDFPGKSPQTTTVRMIVN
jgi:hypothetical protein